MPSFGIERRCDRCRYGTKGEKYRGTVRDDFGCTEHLTYTVINCNRFPEAREKWCNGWCYEFTPTLAVIWARLKRFFNA